MTQTLTASAAAPPAPRGERTERLTERLAALSGVAFVALLLVHAALQASDIPSLTDPADKVVRYVTDSSTEIKVGVVLQGFAIVAYLWFFGSLWRLLRPAEGGPGRLSIVAVAAAVFNGALIGVHIALLGALAVQADAGIERLDPATASTLYVLAFVILGMAAFTSATLMGALGVLIHRTGVLPRWLAVFALANAALWLVAGLGATDDADVWGVLGFLAFLTWLLWTAIASVLVFRRAGAADAVPAVG